MLLPTFNVIISQMQLEMILVMIGSGVEHTDVEVALVRVAASCVLVQSITTPHSALPAGTSLANGTYNRVAKPWTSRAVSALPLDPATVEKRTYIGVSLPSSPRKEAAVRLLKSP